MALFKNQAVSADEILTRADQAMYQAKAAGRNQIRWHTMEDTGSLTKRLAGNDPGSSR